MPEPKKPNFIKRLFGNYDPVQATTQAAIEPIMASYERAIQLQGIPNNERKFISQTQEVATGMIAYLNPKKEPRNYLKFVYFREQYMMYRWYLQLRHRIKNSTFYDKPERQRLLFDNWMSIVHMRSDLITNAQTILTLTFDVIKPVIPILNKPMPVFVSPGGIKMKETKMPGMDE